MRFAETAPPSNKVALNRIVGRFCMILLRRPFGGIRFPPVPGPLGLAGLLHPAELDESLEMVADGALDGRGGGGGLGPRLRHSKSPVSWRGRGRLRRPQW